MEKTYFYPKVDRTAGFFANILEEIEYRLGRAPYNYASGDTGDQTWIIFDPPLSTEEKVVVDEIMAHGCAPPPPEDGETVFEITDLHSNIRQVALDMGLDPDKVRLRYGKSALNLKDCDKIYIYTGAKLDASGIEKVKLTYAASIKAT